MLAAPLFANLVLSTPVSDFFVASLAHASSGPSRWICIAYGQRQSCKICETCTDKTSIDCNSQQRRRLHMNSKTQFIHSKWFTSIVRKITITNTRLSRMCSHQSMGETTTGFCIEIVQFSKTSTNPDCNRTRRMTARIHQFGTDIHPIMHLQHIVK